MFKINSKKLVSGLVATISIAAISLNAADSYGSVNGEQITKEDIAVVLRNPNVNFDSLPKKNKNQIIDQIIDKKLLTENAVKSGIYQEKSYKDALEKLKRDLALEIWMQKEFKSIAVSSKDEKDYYNKNKDNFKIPATLEARHILVKSEADAKKIISTLDKAKNKKDEFINLSKTKSTGPSATNGGYLGKFNEKQMVPEFSKAAKSLEKGKYSKSPVKTQFGYHVIYLEDKNPEQNMAFEQVKNKINGMIKQEKFRDKIKEESEALRKNAKIVIK